MIATMHDVRTVTVVQQLTAVVRATMPAAYLDGWLEGAFEAVDDHLVCAGIAPEGPAFARYAVCDGEVAVEAGYPVPVEVPGNGWVQASMLPGGPAAVVPYRGSQAELDRADEALRGWIAANDHKPAGPHWEVFHTDPLSEPDPELWRSELVAPYES